MKSFTDRAYAILVALCMLLLLYVLATNDKDVTQRQQMSGYRALTDYKYTEVADLQTPLGYREEYVFSFDEIDGSYRDLLIYTEHRRLDVYVDGDRIYRLRAFINNSFGRTPGCVWSSISLENLDEDKVVRVVAMSEYQSVEDEKPLFYFGDKYAIALGVLREQLPTLLLCVIGILAGVLYVVYALYNYRKYAIDRDLLMLGILSIMISLWKLTDNVALYMLFENMVGLYMAPLIFVQLSIIPFVLFAKELNGGGDERVWYIPVFLSAGLLTVILTLQMLEFCDMRQAVWIVYIEWFVAAIVTVWMLLYRVYKQGLDAKRRRNLLLLILCLVVMAADTGIVVLSSKSSFVGMLGFIAYVLLMGMFTVKDAKELMAIGVEARTFENKAYHDQLTGLYNRTAYMDFVSQESFEPEKYIVAVFDLNNLKRCNDTLGHEAGDRYLRECADLLKIVFGEVGRCYRMGGDEFSVLMERMPLEECKKKIRELKTVVDERNSKHPEMMMGIACGYELFDKRLDHDINDTARRADKMMYKEKYAMKQALSE